VGSEDAAASELGVVVEAWTNLPLQIRTRILGLIEGALAAGEGK
jgi:hypothetical protein